ncbi:hypothetical protein LTR84_001651 [Exophiala bonariae]|uniref:Uncharacterized protein n=1 Tax=Exophiala bonariae TaxID=1690606 RepID=A0AAV9NC25_9EURO|nr:hypothetical protein LTR84_001651 [Exophiala bonariae]
MDLITDVSKIQACHLHMEPLASELALDNLTSPITELRVAYFPTTITDTEQAIFEDSIAKFFSRIQLHAMEMVGYSVGWPLEPLSVDGSPQEGKAHVTCVGWQSIEAHEAILKSQVFKDNEHLIINPTGAIHTEIVHFTGVRFK